MQIIPTSRNAFDRVAPGFSFDGTALETPCTCADKGTGCAQGIPGGHCPAGLGPKCASGTMTNVRAEGGGGQPCLWWSQGCSIGCDFCLTDPRHPDNNGSIRTTPITGNPPHADKAGFRKSYCDNASTTAVLPKEYWTMNVHAIPGAVNDSYQFNPWRAPGTAPVIDPCGQAGGKFIQTPMGGDSVFKTVIVDNKTYQMGDMGSKVLPATPEAEMTTWSAGSTPRVAWGMRYNHGGGYQYRLCPAEKMPCTEEDFQKIPLDFVRDSHAIMWNNGSLYPIKGKFVDDSVCPVVPKGSTWARNPIPRIHTDNIGMAFVGDCLTTHGIFPASDNYCSPVKKDCQQFPTPCPELEGATPENPMGDWYKSNGVNESDVPDHNTHEGACSGDWTLGMISDEVVIPKDIAPGKYVLSWRWDCEETAQVWQNCADVNIVASTK
eukprot:m.11026 g.11026  ORF g.11026 m.11026 type:complete len:435 (+) comp4384_c0_seq1:56-1360(+)